MTIKIDNQQAELDSLKAKQCEDHDHVNKVEFHQRINNLLFTGFPEERARESDGTLYNKVMNAISNIPNMQYVLIARIHRLGAYVKGQTRPIIANFHWFGHLKTILQNRHLLMYGVFVSEDYPDEWKADREELKPSFNLARRLPKYQGRVCLTRNKLFLDGKQYSATLQLHQFSPALQQLLTAVSLPQDDRL